MSDFDKSEYWFESAEYDLQTARAMLETRRLLYVGFMCHQTIEKALKPMGYTNRACQSGKTYEDFRFFSPSVHLVWRLFLCYHILVLKGGGERCVIQRKRLA